MTDTLAAPELLRSYAKRWQTILDRQEADREDLKELKAEIKSSGIDAPTMGWAMKELNMDAADRSERDAMRDLYSPHLGLTPSGDA